MGGNCLPLSRTASPGAGWHTMQDSGLWGTQGEDCLVWPSGCSRSLSEMSNLLTSGILEWEPNLHGLL